MKLTRSDVSEFRKEHQRVPLHVLAQRRGCTVIQLCAAVRRGGYALEVQPIELQFILDSFQSMPPRTIQEQLGLTPTQFQQILARLGIRSSRPAANLSFEEVISKTRWLVETALKWTVDDELPRRISGRHFVEHQLYSLVDYATRRKQEDPRFKGYPAVAYLTCVAYPGTFQPFQFRHAKGQKYFSGRDGKRRVLEAARWIAEEKLGLRIALLGTTARSKYFLRNKDLEFYGVPPNTYKRFFKSQSELIEALLKDVGIRHTHGNASSMRLREILEQAGRPPTACEVPGCTAHETATLDIHHIVPKATRTAKIDLHAAGNLVALCPNHHRAARDYPSQSRLSLSADERRDELLRILAGLVPRPDSHG